MFILLNPDNPVQLTISTGRDHSTFSHIFTSRVIGGKHDSSLHAWNLSLPLISPDPPE